LKPGIEGDSMSVRILAVSRLLRVVQVLALTATSVWADEPVVFRPWLTAVIDYKFVGHQDKRDQDGRLLVWQAIARGDLDAEMKWWFVDPAPVPATSYGGGRVTYYLARWEIWIDGELVLAGDSAGKTVFPDNADGMWDGHGVVREAFGDFQAFQGRNVYETGPVIVGSDPPVSFSGSGMFQIY